MSCKTDFRIVLWFICSLAGLVSLGGDGQLLLLLAGAIVGLDVLAGFLIGVRNKRNPIIMLGASFVRRADKKKANNLPLAA
jgi:hypothetical protein